MVFHWILSNSKSPQVSRTLLSILAVLNNAVIGMVSTRPPNSKSSRPFSDPLVTVTKAPITIGTILTFMFHSFSLARSRYLSFFSRSFSYIVASRDGKVDNFSNSLLFFLSIFIKSGLLAEIIIISSSSISIREFFASALADGLSLQGSAQYSGRSQLCGSL